jgi:hypothetical protein
MEELPHPKRQHPAARPLRNYRGLNSNRCCVDIEAFFSPNDGEQGAKESGKNLSTFAS